MEESDRELIERLRHRATEHRNFFGSAKDYELMEQAAARLEALSVGGGREVRVQQFDDETWTVWLDNVRLTSFPSLTGAEDCAEKIRQFAALQPAHSLPVGEGWREAVAALKAVSEDATDGEEFTTLAGDYIIRERVLRKVREALAKADQISALGRGGEGEQGEALERAIGRPMRCLMAELQDVADHIERTKPQGLLYDSALPSLREARTALAALLPLEGGEDQGSARSLPCSAPAFGAATEAQGDLDEPWPLPSGVPTYEDALALVLHFRKPSVSFIQRKLQIGYNKACDYIEIMEAKGIVSKSNTAGLRTMLPADHSTAVAVAEPCEATCHNPPGKP